MNEYQKYQEEDQQSYIENNDLSKNKIDENISSIKSEKFGS